MKNSYAKFEMNKKKTKQKFKARIAIFGGHGEFSVEILKKNKEISERFPRGIAGSSPQKILKESQKKKLPKEFQEESM